MGVTRRCVILFADEDQYDDYSDFKSELEETSNGVVELEDLEDIKAANGGTESEKLRRFLEERQVVIIICSEKMKSLIDHKREYRLELDGNIVNLDGNQLSLALRKEEILKKVILVSFDGSDDIPGVLNNVKAFVKSDSVNKTFVNKVIFQIRGLQL